MANWIQQILEANPEWAALPVVKRARRSLHLRRPDGKILGLFTGDPIHYRDEQDDWQPLDTLPLYTMPLYDAEHGLWDCPGLNVVITSDGIVCMGGYSQHTRRIGLFRPSTMRLLGTRNVPLGNRVGDALIADGGWWQVERRIISSGYRELLTLKEQPSIPQAKAGDYLVLETLVGGVSLPNGWVQGQYNISEHWSPLPTAWQANGEPLTCRRYWKDGVLYTGIPVAELAQAVYPIVIDPDFTGDTADAQIRGRDAVYATARDTSLDFAATATYVAVGQRFVAGPYYYIYRAFLKFDTSAIGAGPIISQVNLVLTLQQDVSDRDFDVQIIKQDWSAQDPVGDANREAAFDNCLAGILDAVWRNTSGISIETNYPSPNLDITWPDPEGDTYYSLRSDRDKNANVPIGQENVLVCSKEHATAEWQPFLTILYEEEAEGNPWYYYAQQQ